MTEEKMARARAPMLDAMIENGHVHRVLDKGHIRVVDYMGNDDAIVQAARVSYGKGTKTVSDDRHLIRYLMRNRHTTPFEMCELKLHVRVPMDHWRQWIRHRTASVNEYSTRYSEAIDDKQCTLPGEWRFQSGTNKQGSGDYLDEETGQAITHAEQKLHEHAWNVYKERLELGIAREQARKDLPLSTYTEAYWKCDLHNLFHFLSLRMDPHAQKEIRAYANCIGNIVRDWVPGAWCAFDDYRLQAMYLSRMEIQVLNQWIAALGNSSPVEDLADDIQELRETAKEFGWLKKKSRERLEFDKKLERLGLELPWFEEES